MAFDKARAQSMIDQVRANLGKLDQCPDHQFERESEDVLTSHWRCARCGGSITGMAYRWYMRGRAHGAEHGAGEPA